MGPRFGLRAYDTYREKAARSPCSFHVLRRRGTAGQLLLVSLSPCRSCSRNHSSLYCKPIDRQGDVVRSVRVPLLYPCRYAREKLSVRESDRRCSPFAFCPKRISVGRAHHRKRMYSIRRFRAKLTFRRNLLLFYIKYKHQHLTYYPICKFQSFSFWTACDIPNIVVDAKEQVARHNQSAEHIYIYTRQIDNKIACDTPSIEVDTTHNRYALSLCKHLEFLLVLDSM